MAVPPAPRPGPEPGTEASRPAPGGRCASSSARSCRTPGQLDQAARGLGVKTGVRLGLLVGVELDRPAVPLVAAVVLEVPAPLVDVDLLRLVEEPEPRQTLAD